MIHYCRKPYQRAIAAKQERKQAKLTIVTCRSYPDYDPVSIDEKFIKQGAD